MLKTLGNSCHFLLAGLYLCVLVSGKGLFDFEHGNSKSKRLLAPSPSKPSHKYNIVIQSYENPSHLGVAEEKTVQHKAPIFALTGLKDQISTNVTSCANCNRTTTENKLGLSGLLFSQKLRNNVQNISSAEEDFMNFSTFNSVNKSVQFNALHEPYTAYNQSITGNDSYLSGSGGSSTLNELNKKCDAFKCSVISTIIQPGMIKIKNKTETVSPNGWSNVSTIKLPFNYDGTKTFVKYSNNRNKSEIDALKFSESTATFKPYKHSPSPVQKYVTSNKTIKEHNRTTLEHAYEAALRPNVFEQSTEPLNKLLKLSIGNVENATKLHPVRKYQRVVTSSVLLTKKLLNSTKSSKLLPKINRTDKIFLSLSELNKLDHKTPNNKQVILYVTKEPTSEEKDEEEDSDESDTSNVLEPDLDHILEVVSSIGIEEDFILPMSAIGDILAPSMIDIPEERTSFNRKQILTTEAPVLFQPCANPGIKLPLLSTIITTKATTRKPSISNAALAPIRTTKKPSKSNIKNAQLTTQKPAIKPQLQSTPVFLLSSTKDPEVVRLVKKMVKQQEQNNLPTGFLSGAVVEFISQIIKFTSSIINMFKSVEGVFVPLSSLSEFITPLMSQNQKSSDLQSALELKNKEENDKTL